MLLKFTKKQVSIALTLFAVPYSAQSAVTPNPYVTENGMEVLPSVDVKLLHDDNLSNNQEDSISSWGTVIAPAVSLKLNPGQNEISAKYRIARGDYYSSKEDNYTDHFVALDSLWVAAERHRFMLNYDFIASHEERGDGLSEGAGDLIDEVVRFHTHEIFGKYRFGRPGATGRLDFELGYVDKAFRNFESVTQYRDYDQMHYATAFYYRVAPKTSLLLEAIKNDKRYKKNEPGSSSRDSDDHYFYLGATWDTTASVTGIAKVGYQHKRFKAGSRKNFEDVSWDIGLTWQPKDYTSLELGTLRRAKDPDQEGDYIQESSYRVAWEHYWLPRFASTLKWSYVDDEYYGVDRNDETNKFMVGVNYDFRRWVNFGLGYQLVDKSSNLERIGYDKNLFFVTAKVVM